MKGRARSGESKLQLHYFCTQFPNYVPRRRCPVSEEPSDVSYSICLDKRSGVHDTQQSATSTKVFIARARMGFRCEALEGEPSWRLIACWRKFAF